MSLNRNDVAQPSRGCDLVYHEQLAFPVLTAVPLCEILGDTKTSQPEIRSSLVSEFCEISSCYHFFMFESIPNGLINLDRLKDVSLFLSVTKQST